VVVERPRILFVGINPSLRSAEVGHHFAGRGNPFWRLLHSARLVPVPLTCEEDRRLPEFGYGLMNLCERATRSAAELANDEMQRGVRRVQDAVRRLRPDVVALVGVTLYRRFFPGATSAGAGLKPETVHGARVFVLPNPSGLNASCPGFSDKLVWFRRLAETIEGSEPRH
jgi:TDG/mug DNA glycosylase family protein